MDTKSIARQALLIAEIFLNKSHLIMSASAASFKGFKINKPYLFFTIHYSFFTYLWKFL